MLTVGAWTWVKGPWGIGGVAAVIAASLLGIGVLRAPGQLDVFLEPAGAVGADPFLTLDGDPDLRLGSADLLSLGGGVTLRVGIEPGLYGGSGSDGLCDPQLIADFLAGDQAKATAWAGAAGIDVDHLESYLETLTPVRLLADTWVTNHGFRDGRATPRQSVLQAGTMVLVDRLGVPRVRCKCGNPLLEPEVPGDLDDVRFVGDPWDGFDPERLLVIQAGLRVVEGFVLVRLEDGRLIARPFGTTGADDVLVDDDGNWIPELDLALPPMAAVGDGPFTLPELNSAGLELRYELDGPCDMRDGELTLTGKGLCVLTVTSSAEEPWAELSLSHEIEVGSLSQEIVLAAVDRLVLGEDPIELGAIADSALPVSYEVEGPCEVIDGVLTATGVGTCELTVTQPGDERWDAAEPITISIEISDDPPRERVVLVFDPPVSARFGGETLTLNATATPDRPVSFIASGVCAITGGSTLRLVGVGTCEVVAVVTADDEVQRAVVTRTITVEPRLQTVGLDTLPTFAVLSAAAVPLPATTSAGFDIDYVASGACRITDEGLVFTQAGDCELQGSAAGDRENEPVTETINITVSPSSAQRLGQTITFAQPGSLVVGGGGVPATASASSGLPVSITVTAGGCSLSGSTLSPGDAGSCTVTASQNGDASYEPASSVSRTVTVAKLSPTLNVGVSGGSATEMVAGETRTVTGTVSSGPSASIAQTSGPCTSSGNTVQATGTAAGDCVVTVSAPGDTNHNPVSATVTIGVKLPEPEKRQQTVSLTLRPTSLAVGQLATPTASASSQLAVVLSASPSGVCRLDGGQILAVGPGTCTVSATQAGNDDYVAASNSATLEVVAPRQTSIKIDAPGSMTVGDQVTIQAVPEEPNAVVTISVQGTACESPRRGVIVGLAEGTCTVTASHPATSDYQAASATASITVERRTDSLTFTCDRACNEQVGQSRTYTITSQSGLRVEASVSGACVATGIRSVGGGVAIIFEATGVGSCTVGANTDGDSQWGPVKDSVTVKSTAAPAPSATLGFDLGQGLTLDQTKSFDIVHNIPRDVVTARITGSDACSAFIGPAGLNGSVTGKALGTCSVTVTVSGGGFAPTSLRRTIRVDLPLG